MYNYLMQVLTMKDRDIWLSKFESLRETIISGKDKLKDNYREQNMPLSEQEDATVVWKDNSIVAFSFLQNRSFWGNISRVFSRTYIVPEYRKKFLTSGGTITNLMLTTQISIAKSRNRDFAFISRHYPSRQWPRNFIAKYPEWKFNDQKLYKVCQGPEQSCLQHCLVLPLTNEDKKFPLLDFPLPLS